MTLLLDSCKNYSDLREDETECVKRTATPESDLEVREEK